MNYVLGIDGGGSKTHALCADEEGHEVGEGLAGPINLTATELGSASFNLQEVIRQATQSLPKDWRITKMVIGSAGLDTQKEIDSAHEIFSQALQYVPIDDILLVNDTVIALESGTDKPNAIVLIAGTGSNCWGRNAEGKEDKTGGLDFLLADEGSAYAIGHEVLRSALQSYDGRGLKSELEHAVMEYFRIQDMKQLKVVVYHPLLNKMEIGAVAKLCTTAVEHGDAVAISIFEHAISDLKLMVDVVLRKLDLENRPADCVFVGSILTVPYIKDKLIAQLHDAHSQLNIITSEKPAVYGAVRLALRQSAK